MSLERESNWNGEVRSTCCVATPAKKVVHRCSACGKRVGLTGVRCRCHRLFCALHVYAEEHGCTFDYRAWAADQIRANNPVVVAEKIRKI